MSCGKAKGISNLLQQKSTAVASWDFLSFCHSHAAVSCFFQLYTVSSLAFAFPLPVPPSPVLTLDWKYNDYMKGYKMTVSALCLWSFLSYGMYLFFQIFSSMLTSHARIFSYKYNIVGEFQNLWGFLHIKFINAPPSQTTLKTPTNNPIPKKPKTKKQPNTSWQRFLSLPVNHCNIHSR